MDAQVLNNLLTVQSYITTLEGMIERLENELTPSEKQILEELRSQYHSARLVYVQQMGVPVSVESKEPNEIQKEPHKEPVKEDGEKKVQPPRTQQKQQQQQAKKPKEEYPE